MICDITNHDGTRCDIECEYTRQDSHHVYYRCWKHNALEWVVKK